MSGTHFIFNSSLFAMTFFLLLSCGNEKGKQSLIEFKGKTMGAGYSISYHDSLNRNFQPQIDSLLAVFDKEISTYREDSRLMAFNKSDSGILITNSDPQHLTRNFKTSMKIFEASSGWFNPAVMPLVNYWGFGKGEKKGVENPDTALIDSLVKLCDFNGIELIEKENAVFIRKKNPKTQVVLNAIAPGDAADEIGRFLEKNDIRNYLIEIGGEIRCRGKQSKNFGWMVGINTPKENAALNDMQVVVELNNMSLATSGNYRNFIEVKGKKYAHTINPFTGFPEKNALLSASIFTADCADADAIATACMAMGPDKAWDMIAKMKGVEAYFIYSDEKGEMKVKHTDKIAAWLKQ
jgi:thiamine biosynthesis lipoprotein